MPFNGSGTFTRSSGQPVVSGTVISSTTFNTYTADVANNGLSNCITKDGQTTVTQNIPLSGNKLTGVGDATALTDAMNVKGLQNGSFVNLSSVSGTDTITATVTPVPSAYTSGQMFVFVPANTNTGATTINISSLGAKNIFLDGSALSGGELVAGVPVGIRYDGTQFEIMFVGRDYLADAAQTNAANTFTEDQTIESDTAGASAGPFLTLYRAITGAANNFIGGLKFDGQSDNGTRRTFVQMFSQITDATDGAESARSFIRTRQSGTFADRLIIALGLYTPNATGGDQGADTVNASELYEDSTRVATQDDLLSLGSPVDATNGGANDLTEIDFTSIKSGAKRIEIPLSQISLSGNNNLLIQIGDSGGVETSGYDSQSGDRSGVSNSTNGFVVEISDSSLLLDAIVELLLVDSANNKWVSRHAGSRSGNAPLYGAGSKTLSAEIDRVRVTTSGGNTFDNGTLNRTVE